ncbi:MAG: proline--tRNA ligase [Cytophagales bacterium]
MFHNNQDSKMRFKLPSRKEDFPAWYQAVIREGALATQTDTPGAVVIMPHAYALWENIKHPLDQAIKATGHQNLYFPLLIPVDYFQKEEAHVKGFSKECAVVTHHRLKTTADGKKIVPDPKAKLEIPLVVRPTSETIIWHHFSKWTQSHRDLPLLYNQWANVVRWELRTRVFIRDREFQWQEGHTAHATAAEAKEETLKMLYLYRDVIEKKLAIPLMLGEKTAHERFAGAVATYTIEGLMQDGKALQMGTAHFLGQNFAKAFKVKFTNEQGAQEHAWGTSFGVTSRLIGGVIMTHGDDKGLVLPPEIAPIQAVIIPIYKKGTAREVLLATAEKIQKNLQKVGIKVKIDDSDLQQPGWKFNAYERKGVPLRIAIGPRDLTKQQVEVTQRDTGEKRYVPMATIVKEVQESLTKMQESLYQKAVARIKNATHKVDDWDTFKKILKTTRGFILAHWDGTTATEAAIQQETGATIRCIPLAQEEEEGRCIYTNKPSKRRVAFAMAY